MKAIINIFTCVMLMLTSSVCLAQEFDFEFRKKKKVEKVDSERYLLDRHLWETPIYDFYHVYKGYKFKWQTAAKQSLRAEGKLVTTFGTKTGEIVIKSDGEDIKYVIISLYNKGDNSQIDMSAFNKLASNMESKLTEKLGTSPKDIAVDGAVKMDTKVWKWKDTAFVLEKSVTGRNAEFLRLKVSSVKTNRRGDQTAGKLGLKSNVVYDKGTGDVYIPNVPMIDQGQKGYCACASTARIYQYYGRIIGQHEIAEMAGSTAGGTYPSEMVAALKKASKHLESRVLILHEYPKHMTSKDLDMRKWESGQREMLRDFNSYQQLAKRLKTPGLKIDGKEYGKMSKNHMINYYGFVQQCDPDTFRQIMVKKSSFKRWKNKVREYIDQGIPIGWGLQLGMFKEPNLPQANGGHMRLIIGYNDKTDEIIYSDSWGAGHEKKNMDAGNAFCMSQVILVLPPKK